MTPSLDIVVVTFNARAELAACLGSLREAPPSRAHTIVVVDNASSDGTPAWLRTERPDVQLIANAANAGFARANNQGIRATRGDLVLLLNPDTLVPRGAVDRLAGALIATPDAAAAGPRLVDGRGVPELSFGAMIGPWSELRQKWLVALHTRGVPPVAAWVRRATARRGFPDWVSGACLLVWRRDAEAAGLLDERFFMYTEDVDFCAALRANGRRVLFTPDAEVVHLRGRSRATAPAATASAYRRSQLAFYRKHHPRWAPLLRGYLRLKGEPGLD